MRWLLIVLVTQVACGLATAEVDVVEQVVAPVEAPPAQTPTPNPVWCETTCGVRFADYAGCQKVEDAVLQAYAGVDFDGRRTAGELCSALEGLRVEVSADLGELAGAYFPSERMIRLTAGDWRRIVVPHEFGHALDHALTGYLGHDGWEARGFPTSLETWSYQVYYVVFSR